MNSNAIVRSCKTQFSTNIWNSMSEKCKFQKKNRDSKREKKTTNTKKCSGFLLKKNESVERGRLWATFRTVLFLYSQICSQLMITRQLCRQYVARNRRALGKMGPTGTERACSTLLGMGSSVAHCYRIIFYILRLSNARSLKMGQKSIVPILLHGKQISVSL